MLWNSESEWAYSVLHTRRKTDKGEGPVIHKSIFSDVNSQFKSRNNWRRKHRFALLSMLDQGMGSFSCGLSSDSARGSGELFIALRKLSVAAEWFFLLHYPTSLSDNCFHLGRWPGHLHPVVLFHKSIYEEANYCSWNSLRLKL